MKGSRFFLIFLGVVMILLIAAMGYLRWFLYIPVAGNIIAKENPIPTGALFQFAVIGDYGKDNQSEALVAALVNSWNPEFVITTGDNNYPDGEASTIDFNIGKYYSSYIGNYQGNYGNGSAKNSFWPSLGNHDWNSIRCNKISCRGPYFDFFTLLGNERYYDVNYGLVHLFAVDSDLGEIDGVSQYSDQAIWLRETLATSNACFKVVYFHHPPYSSGDHGSTNRMQWPFQSWGADVVLSGHDHLYERLEADGFPYIVNGAGGANLYAFSNIGNLPAGVNSISRYNADHGAMLVSVFGDGITYQFYNTQGQLVDEFSQAKSCPGYPTRTPSPSPTPSPHLTDTDTPPPSPTPSETSTPTPYPPGEVIQFAVIGDYGKDNSSEALVAALVNRWNPDFVITTGDNNYPDGEASTIDRNIGQYYSSFIGNYQGGFGSGSEVNKFWPALGNHDWHTLSCNGNTCTGAYFDYFTLPMNERYYDLDYGVVHLFALDSDTNEPDGSQVSSQQAMWLKNSLAASKACFNMVFFHHPTYSSGDHGSTSRMEWPFKTWGVDAVFSGHDHLYERLDGDGLPYFVNGAGGAGLYEFTNLGNLPLDVTSMVRYNADYGAMLVSASEIGITYRFYNTQGQLIDELVVPKTCLGFSTKTPTPTNSLTPTTFHTPIPTQTFTILPTSTRTRSPTSTVTFTITPIPSQSSTTISTFTPEAIISPTSTPTITPVSLPTQTASFTDIPDSSQTPSPSATVIPSDSTVNPQPTQIETSTNSIFWYFLPLVKRNG